jgi:hypothetical protein
MHRRLRLTKARLLVEPKRYQRLSPERVRFLSEKEKLYHMPRSYFVLKRKLLSFGGNAVVPQPATEMRAIMSRGQLFVPGKGYGYKWLHGAEPIACHENAARMWYASRGNVKIATGWALSGDGLWRQHSWGVENGNIIETTVKRLKYYGAILTPRESKIFYMSNVHG